jgi:hypothetical protein
MALLLYLLIAIVPIFIVYIFVFKKKKKQTVLKNNNNLPNQKKIWKNIDFKPLIPPRDIDDDRFIQSFSLNDDKFKIDEFYNKYGFVVFKDVLSKNEIEDTINDIWDHLELKYGEFNLKIKKTLNEFGEKIVNRNNPETWEVKNGWPMHSQLGNL